MLIAFNKPYDVLSQFTRELPTHKTLADFDFPPDVYPIGRLDRDSEGLLLLSDEPAWTDQLLNPRNSHPRTYHAQVEGVADDETIQILTRGGIKLDDHLTLPCRARLIEPTYPPRDPPVRFRKNIPTSWVELTLTEGKNRQVRRMTAASGHPTLRLIRVAMGNLSLQRLDLAPGAWRKLTEAEIDLLATRPTPRLPSSSDRLRRSTSPGGRGRHRFGR
ncbi:MAG: pseudouridine synthase [Verrucomicrobiaceae bacterium]|nr:pseudouridine synthase [Verrucomicrobiaceae bacterium]